MHAIRTSFRAGVSCIPARLFVVSVAATIARYGSMTVMGAMPMPGRWTMSMA